MKLTHLCLLNQGCCSLVGSTARVPLALLLVLASALSLRLGALVGFDPLDEALYQTFALSGTAAPGWSVLYIALYKFYYFIGFDPGAAFTLHRLLVLGLLLPLGLFLCARILVGASWMAAVLVLPLLALYGIAGSMPYIHLLNFACQLILLAAYHRSRGERLRLALLTGAALLVSLRTENVICLGIWTIYHLRTNPGAWRKVLPTVGAALMVVSALGGLKTGPRVVLAFGDHLRWNPALELSASELPRPQQTVLEYCLARPAVCSAHVWSMPWRFLQWSQRVLQWPTVSFAVQHHLEYFLLLFSLFVLSLARSSLKVGAVPQREFWYLLSGPALQVLLVSAVFSPWPRYIGGPWVVGLLGLASAGIRIIRRRWPVPLKTASVTALILGAALGMIFYRFGYVREFETTVQIDRALRELRAQYPRIKGALVTPTGLPLMSLDLAEARRARFLMFDRQAIRFRLAEYLDAVDAQLFCAASSGYDRAVLRGLEAGKSYLSDFERLVATGKDVGRFGEPPHQLTCLPWPQEL